MLESLKNNVRLLRRSKRHVILFELTYKLLAVAVIYPILTAAINLCMKVAGIRYLTNEYIVKALTNPVVIIALFTGIILFVGYCIYEMAYLAVCFETKRKGNNASIIDNIYMMEGKNFRQSYKKSSQIVRNNRLRVIMSVIVYNLAIFVAIAVFYTVISLILIGGVKLLDMAYLGSAVYLSVLRELRAGVKIFLVFISIPCSFSMISYMYYKYSDLDDIEFEFVDIDEGSARVNRIIYAVVLALSIVLDIIYIIGSFNNNPFERVAIFHNTDITAHRGASVDAPENTLASFSKAIEDMADVIELDVQMTKDGYIVVMHDKSAYRTTGVLKNITELTLREVKKLDAGYWYSEEYKGEKVPTLEEVLQLAKGKIKLNIEIKTADNSDEVAKKVVKLIQKYSMQDSCVITSFDYSALQAVRSYDEDIEVGYILSVAYGKFYEIDDVDFFSVNASFLTKRVVDAIHNSGKQVYAWTVNNDASIKNLTNKGVDNIITDKPVTAREVIYSRDTSETLINMIKYVFNQ